VRGQSPIVTASRRGAVLAYVIAEPCIGVKDTADAVKRRLAVTSTPFSPADGEVYWPRILASALALSLTGAVMVLLHVNHPPAGATTMIVSLGILAKPGYLPIIEIAVVLLALQAFAISRLAGLPYPIWRSHKPDTGGSQ
jgi:HPP family